MDQRISSIALGVADLARSRRFYEDGLGWKCGGTETEIALYQVGGMVLALFSRAALAADANLESEGTGFGGITLAYNVGTRGEVDAVLAEAKAAGATILKSAEDASWGGYAGYFADLDGHPWEVAWNPHWTLEADGSTRLQPST